MPAVRVRSALEFGMHARINPSFSYEKLDCIQLAPFSSSDTGQHLYDTRAAALHPGL